MDSDPHKRLIFAVKRGNDLYRLPWSGRAVVEYRRAPQQINFVFAYPGLLMLPVVSCTAMLIDEFEWTGRRYRFPNSGDVEVLDSVDEQ